MIKPFRGDFQLTQKFGENPDNYSQFGLKGHDGLDFGLPTGTQVIAPHGGTVIEAQNDPKGYGNYIKIENDKEGSVLAHLQTFQVKVGDVVSAGQPIALSDNTGNSTGPHLHWGYYTLPRDRSNGYAGFIDQLPLLTVPTVSVDSDKFKELVDKSNKYDQFNGAGYTTLDDVNKKVGDLQNDNTNKQNTILDLQKQIATLADEVKAIRDEDATYNQQALDSQKRVSEITARLGLPEGSTDLAVNSKIDGLLKPHEEVVKNVQPTLDGLAKAAIYKRTPKLDSALLEKIVGFPALLLQKAVEFIYGK